MANYQQQAAPVDLVHGETSPLRGTSFERGIQTQLMLPVVAVHELKVFRALFQVVLHLKLYGAWFGSYEQKSKMGSKQGRPPSALMSLLIVNAL